MRTAGEIFLETIKQDGRPERQLKQYEALGFTFKDPINVYLRAGQKPGSISRDRWGTTIAFPEDAPGKTPIITQDNKVCPDITRWREFVHAPDIETAAEGDWTAAAAQIDEIRAGGQLATLLMGTGIFEQCHFLMGIEDTLTNMYEHPAEMHELIDYIFEYRLKYAQLLIENLHPDVILSHDDWGTRNSLFMQPDMWREFFKEPYRKFYSYIRSQGVVVIHHADSYLVPIVEDMVEIGIQVWQGVLPENDIPALLKQLDGRMTLMGGIGAVIDSGDVTEEQAREYVREVLEDCCPYGHFIPCITYGMKGTINKQVDPYIDAEIDKYNGELHFRKYVRSKKPDAVAGAGKGIAAEGDGVQDDGGATTPADGNISPNSGKAQSGGNISPISGNISPEEMFGEISQAVYACDRAQALELCRRALGAGVKASTIIDAGLVAGMTRIGAAFSEGKVFVPEMLLAAKIMSAALEILRPMLGNDAGGEKSPSDKKTKLRAVIGTIEGDLHDIGKNLVRIMMEGSGIEVIDLGSNVAAEDFVDTAVENNCDIIACSSLLSTTMGNMRRVVELAEEAGIRDRVKIMVGGAPVSQEFCDEIGADVYTPDAGAAARYAQSLMGASL